MAQMIEEQREEAGADAAELRHMAEEERRELLEQIAELEGHVTVRSPSSGGPQCVLTDGVDDSG